VPLGVGDWFVAAVASIGPPNFATVAVLIAVVSQTS